MHGLQESGLPEWKQTVLVTITLIVIAAAHVHSARQAWSEMRQRELPTRWRRALSYVARHELHYAKRVPLLIFFVVVAVIVIVTL
jgi:hypothetical protein